MKKIIAGLAVVFSACVTQAGVIALDGFDGGSGNLNGRVTPVGALTWNDNNNRAQLANDQVEVSANNQLATVQTNVLATGLGAMVSADFQLNGAGVAGGYGGATIGMYDGNGSLVVPSGDGIAMRLITVGAASGKISLGIRDGGAVVSSQTSADPLAGYNTDPIRLSVSYANLTVTGMASNTVTGATVSEAITLTLEQANSLAMDRFGFNISGYQSGTVIWDNFSLEQITYSPDSIDVSDNFNSASGTLNGRVTPEGGLTWSDKFSRAKLTNDQVEVSVNNQLAWVQANALGNGLGATVSLDFLMNGAGLAGSYGGATIGMFDGNGSFVIPSGDGIAMRLVATASAPGKITIVVRENGTIIFDKSSDVALSGYDTDPIKLSLSFKDLIVTGTASNMTSGATVSETITLTQEQADALLLDHFGFNTTGYQSGTVVWDNFLLNQSGAVFETIGLVTADFSNSNLILSWQGHAAGTYALQYRESLITKAWSNIVENIAGVNGPMAVTNAIAGSQAFYRLIGE